VHDPLPAQPHFADEGAANHVRLCADHGEAGVNLFVWGREAWERWDGRYPARQTREAFEAVERRHGAARGVFARQGRAAINGGAFHNDVVCVGTRQCLLFHERAFEDRAAMETEVRRAADGLFEPAFVEISEADLPMDDLVKSYLFNSQLLVLPGEDRLVLLAPGETRDNPRAHAAAQALASSNGPIGRVEYVDVRQSMRNGGGPACLRLRVVLTDAELAATNPAQRFDAALHQRLNAWAERRYRDRLAPADLADPSLIVESREALDELTAILDLGGDFYPFQRAAYGDHERLHRSRRDVRRRGGHPGLHRKVAAQPGGLARQPEEVTADYVAHALAAATNGGVNLVAEDVDGALCGELHAERMTVAIFAHVLTDLTVAVDPDWQGRGVGSALFRALIDTARTMTPPIGRIELWTGAANSAPSGSTSGWVSRSRAG
jgi:GNAT superfamily N-acetyltransferase